MSDKGPLNDTEVAYLYAICKADSKIAHQYIRRLHRHGVIPDPPDVFAAERCSCEAFNEAVNEEMIFWDGASEEEVAWCTGETALHVNFCPFCGKLPPLTAHFT